MTSIRIAAVVLGCLLAGPAAGGAQGLQGFNIVLVQGDLQGGTDSELPGPAQAAIADVKNFLPFKSYRLIDSAWILASSQATALTNRLKGLDGQDYQVTIESEGQADNAQRISFKMREVADRSAGAADHAAEARARVEQLTADYQAQRRRYNDLLAQEQSLLSKLNEKHPDVLKLQSQLPPVRDRLLQTERAMELARVSRVISGSTGPAAAGATLMDTTFQMRVGETVVVGTSRVRGDKALLALLTAVPRSGK